jgi:hypothetical protein
LELARLYPRFVTIEDSGQIDRPVTKQEIWEILKLFSIDKSPGPDGWTVEFYIKFFDVVGDDLLDLVEDTRIRGRVRGSLNMTFWR